MDGELREMIGGDRRETIDGEFRDMMAAFPTGVSVVTAQCGGDAPWGMTCSSLCSLSVDPPALLICLRAQSPTLEAVLAGGAFAVNLLHGDAESVAALFASGATDRFERVAWKPSARTGSPALVEAAHAVADCTVVRSHPAGDHVIVVGAVRAVEHYDRGSALLYGFRQYGQWSRSLPVSGGAHG
ncbi:flavin reductase family protein [Streptomyces viridochromogenes]|uniref:Putative NADH-FMN oxidoreductase n=1 Tax=Streptomyces viridochromogenes Tue57 TaxID=1160705 RepID=L8P4N2_STRVR|nr:flavin reductase family protein [Streptomyces viridochromogenes]ELS50237.1 putative NADH-FMN oxidoreductase [Streptomyces viridochromogenes Tue57]